MGGYLLSGWSTSFVTIMHPNNFILPTSIPASSYASLLIVYFQFSPELICPPSGFHQPILSFAKTTLLSIIGKVNGVEIGILGSLSLGANNVSAIILPFSILYLLKCFDTMLSKLLLVLFYQVDPPMLKMIKDNVCLLINKKILFLFKKKKLKRYSYYFSCNKNRKIIFCSLLTWGGQPDKIIPVV